MANLRENNQRLQVESLSASEQLRKFSRLYNNNDTTESDNEANSLTYEADSKREWLLQEGEWSTRPQTPPLSFHWTALNRKESKETEKLDF